MTEHRVRRPAHRPGSADEQRRMLEAVGYGSVDELMDAAIPEVIRWHGALDLPPAATEAEALAELRALAARNTVADLDDRAGLLRHAHARR